MMKFMRQSDIIDYSKIDNTDVTVIGLGGIGSPLVYSLIKMGIPGQSITGYDHDHVDEVNLNSQFYRHTDVGQSKATALAKAMLQMENQSFNAVNDMYVDQPINNICVMAVDSIDARRDIFRKVRKMSDVNLIIDARMGAEFTEIYSMPTSNRGLLGRYTKTLHHRDEVVREPCTRKAIVYTTISTSGFIANLIKKFLLGEELPECLQIDHINMEIYKTSL